MGYRPLRRTYIFWGTGNEANEIAYFSYVLLFGPAFIIGTALGGFFIARGSVKIVTVCTILVNVFNLILAPVMIFGAGPIPALGIEGAAIALGLSNVLGALVYLCIFLTPHNRQEYGTGCWQFHRKVFLECLRIGLPSGLGHINELLAHFVFFRLVIMAGGYGLTIISLVQTVFLAGHFIVEGISKSVTAIASNLIGGGQTHLLNKVLWSAVKLLAIFTTLLTCTMLYRS